MVVRPTVKRRKWLWFIAMAVAGLTVALFVFFTLAMAECLPRDGSLNMHACDTAKQRELWLYPVITGSLLAIAIRLHVRDRAAGGIVALGSGLASALILWLVQTSIG